MASNTKNVKLGVCQVLFDGVDLGYTQGGVDVTVKTDTHQVQVDQFGKTTINEYLMGRMVTAKVPLAEVTLDNMVAIMPGAVMTTVGGSVATGTITIATVPTASDTILVNGKTITWVAAVTDAYSQVLIPAAVTTATAAAALAAFLQGSTDVLVANASYAAAAAVVTVTYGSPLIYAALGMKSTEGNSFTLVTGTSGAKTTMSGATLTGGTAATSKSVLVSSGIGVDLLSIAKELRFHPVSSAANDRSDDFVIPLAATAGALTFAYKLENERIYNVDFTGYPDPFTKQLFGVGI